MLYILGGLHCYLRRCKVFPRDDIACPVTFCFTFFHIDKVSLHREQLEAMPRGVVEIAFTPEARELVRKFCLWVHGYGGGSLQKCFGSLTDAKEKGVEVVTRKRFFSHMAKNQHFQGDISLLYSLLDTEPRRGYFEWDRFNLLSPYFQDVVAKIEAQRINDAKLQSKISLSFLHAIKDGGEHLKGNKGNNTSKSSEELPQQHQTVFPVEQDASSISGHRVVGVETSNPNQVVKGGSKIFAQEALPEQCWDSSRPHTIRRGG